MSHTSPLKSVPLPALQASTRDDLVSALQAAGEPSYRADQILRWIYQERVSEWAQMNNLPKALREKLSLQFAFPTLELVKVQGARDVTRKFLWKLHDQSMVECVLIPANPSLYGEESDRRTLCVSTQVGCAYGCKFCASGLDGWKRNLRVEEIVEQVLSVERWYALEEQKKAEAAGQKFTPGRERAINNLVIMGMGEPLANYDSLMKALRILNAPWGGNLGARKITISTSGLAPQIKKLADEPMQFRLAISLHGATDEVRNRIMPVNRKYPLAELSAACMYYQEKKGRMITLEYILIKGVNDHRDQVNPLAKLAHKLHAKVNLIPYNTVEGLTWERPDENTQEEFLEGLERLRVTATLRREKGHDIDAACGQLRLKTERELAAKELGAKSTPEKETH